jgi:hAT family C-terminal dimerisation region
MKLIDFQMNSSSFPTLFKMAMDYLPIQASSVPSERVFSSSAETDTKKRNRISPLLMEALQMLKFYLKKKRLDFTESWVTTELQMTVDDPDDDLLGKLLRNVGGQPGRDVFEAIIRSIEADEGPIEG